MSIWETPEVLAMQSGGNFAKWATPGDTIVGKVLAISPKGGTTAPPKSEPCPLLVIEQDDGEEVKITVSQTKLLDGLIETKPEVGDRVAIVFERVERLPNGNTLKHFDVQVKRATEVAAEKPRSLL